MSVTHQPHGSPDPREHALSYHHFLVALRYIVLALAVVISFLLVWFGFRAGWVAASIIALIELAVGGYFAYDRHPERP